MTIPTPLIALVIFVASLAAIVGLTIAGEGVPAELKYSLVGSLTAALGGAVPSVNVGK